MQSSELNGSPSSQEMLKNPSTAKRGSSTSIQELCHSTHKDLISLLLRFRHKTTDEELRQHKTQVDELFRGLEQNLVNARLKDMVNEAYVSTYMTVLFMQANLRTLQSSLDGLSNVARDGKSWALSTEWKACFADVGTYVEQLNSFISQENLISRLCVRAISDCFDLVNNDGLKPTVVHSLLSSIENSTKNAKGRVTRNNFIVDHLRHFCSRVKLCLKCTPTTECKPDEQLLDLLKELKVLTVKGTEDPTVYNSTGEVVDTLEDDKNASEFLTMLNSRMRSSKGSCNNDYYDLHLLGQKLENAINSSVSSAQSSVDLIGFYHERAEDNKPRKKRKTQNKLLTGVPLKDRPEHRFTPVHKCHLGDSTDGTASRLTRRLRDQMKGTYNHVSCLFSPDAPPEKKYKYKTLVNMTHTQKIRSKLYNAHTAITFFLKKCGLLDKSNDNVVYQAINQMCDAEESKEHHQEWLKSPKTLNKALFEAIDDICPNLNFDGSLAPDYRSLVRGDRHPNTLYLLCTGRVPGEKAKSVPRGYQWRMEYLVFHPYTGIVLPFPFIDSEFPAALEFPYTETDSWTDPEKEYLQERFDTNLSKKTDKGAKYKYDLVELYKHSHHGEEQHHVALVPAKDDDNDDDDDDDDEVV